MAPQIPQKVLNIIAASSRSKTGTSERPSATRHNSYLNLAEHIEGKPNEVIISRRLLSVKLDFKVTSGPNPLIFLKFIV